jgi:hypothetical protein
MKVITRPDVQYERHLLERNASQLEDRTIRAPFKEQNGLAASCSYRQVVSIPLLLLLSSSSSSSLVSPLCRVTTLIFLRQTMSLGNTVLQLF